MVADSDNEINNKESNLKNKKTKKTRPNVLIDSHDMVGLVTVPSVQCVEQWAYFLRFCGIS